MSREIKNLAVEPEVAPVPETPRSGIDDYKSRLVKLIPSEIVAAYVTIQGLIAGVSSGGTNVSNKHTLMWIVIAALFVMTPVYSYYVSNVRKWRQIIYTSVAFLIWVAVIGCPLRDILGFTSQFLGSIVLIIYTLFIPLLYKGVQ